MMAELAHPDAMYFPILSGIVECLRDELAKAGGPTPCSVSIVGGTVQPSALMTCNREACGLAWVRPVSITPQGFDRFDSNALRSCGSPLVMAFEVGVARCYPRAKERESFPDPQALFEAMDLIMSDMQAMRRAVLCCDPAEKAGVPRGAMRPTISLAEWTPLEVSGGVGGGYWTGSIS